MASSGTPGWPAPPPMDRPGTHPSSASELSSSLGLWVQQQELRDWGARRSNRGCSAAESVGSIKTILNVNRLNTIIIEKVYTVVPHLLQQGLSE